MLILKERLTLCAFLSFLLGCDPSVPLKPDAPSDVITREPGGGWFVETSRHDLSVRIRGTIGPMFSTTHFYAAISNHRSNIVKLQCANLSVQLDGETRARATSGSCRIQTGQKEWFRSEEIIIEPRSTAIVSFYFSKAIYKKTILLEIDAFEDVSTGERIPFAINFFHEG